jgi:hypothetical protein
VKYPDRICLQLPHARPCLAKTINFLGEEATRGHFSRKGSRWSSGEKWAV